MIAKLLCKVLGHDWIDGHAWYPWGIPDWYAYDEPVCKRCGLRKGHTYSI